MAKNRNKKKTGPAAMDITSDQSVADLPQAMDMTESDASKNLHLNPSNRKMKKGVQMKRSKNVRKMKAIAKAISINEKCLEKDTKKHSKTLRTQSAKKLYD